MEPFLRHNPLAPYTPETVPAPDLILVSHAAWDHMGDAAEIARRTGAPVVCPGDVAERLYDEGVPSDQVRASIWGVCYAFGAIVVRPVECHHWSAATLRDGRQVAGVPLSFIVEPEPRRAGFYHFGDTTIFPGLRLIGELYRPTVGIIGVAQTDGLPDPGAGQVLTGEMNPDEAAMAAEWLGLRHAIASHYMNPGPETVEFARRVPVHDTTGTRVVHTPKAGEIIAIEPESGPFPSLTWGGTSDSWDHCVSARHGGGRHPGMVRRADVVIIGSGGFGAAIAWQLAARGQKVALVDKDAIASQTSPRAAGLAATSRTTALMTRLANRAADMLVAFEQETGHDLGIVRNGSLKIAREAEDAVILEREAERGQALGIGTRMLDAGAAAAMHPLLRGDGSSRRCISPGTSTSSHSRWPSASPPKLRLMGRLDARYTRDRDQAGRGTRDGRGHARRADRCARGRGCRRGLGCPGRNARGHPGGHRTRSPPAPHHRAPPRCHPGDPERTLHRRGSVRSPLLGRAAGRRLRSAACARRDVRPASRIPHLGCPAGHLRAPRPHRQGHHPAPGARWGPGQGAPRGSPHDDPGRAAHRGTGARSGRTVRGRRLQCLRPLDRTRHR